MNKSIFIITIGLCIIFFSCDAPKENKDYYHLPTYSSNNNIQAVVEIPAGTNHKIEYDKVARKFIVDSLEGKERIIDFLPYLGNYGFIPSTYSDPDHGGDGDALDVLVLGENTPTGSIMEIIPIAMLEMIDDGAVDHKIIAIPSNEKQRIIKAANFHDFSTQYPAIRKMIGNWFDNYDLKDEVQILRWTGEEAAIREIKKWKTN
ncbi:inorganic diphosphatase [Mesonia sp. JHPTF-M18]|uniref:Inorganic diphosphatase n=2 Tax=Mesonia aestuariivivens TaxID=2796128 RepID=A0ABS6W373_9FLAO|nr:inorganic diphosphatase [Mesonia aestuariivivens]